MSAHATPILHEPVYRSRFTQTGTDEPDAPTCKAIHPVTAITSALRRLWYKFNVLMRPGIHRHRPLGEASC